MVMKLENRSSGSRGDGDLAAGNNDWPVAVGDAWERRITGLFGEIGECQTMGLRPTEVILLLIDAYFKTL
jgi:hypothetical protein